MRLGLTIVFNGLHHLQHNDWAKRMALFFDKWVIVEGLALNSGSTAWCRDLRNSNWHNEGLSKDGTTGFLYWLDKDYDNVTVLSDVWQSKDDMVNAGIQAFKTCCPIRHRDPEHFLWTLDVDEQFSEDDMIEAECMLGVTRGCNSAEFLSDYYVGEHLLAKGEWGEGVKLPYRRLWKWKGERFISHEPPVMEGMTKPILLPQRFKHYAYYYEQDVKFKEQYYTGHDGIYSRWKKLQERPKEDFPVRISELITGSWGQTDTQIVYI